MQKLDKQIICSQADINLIINSVNDALSRGLRIILLSGPLGAGKTSLVQAILKQFGITNAPSPSFVIERMYKIDSQQASTEFDIANIFHADLFRLQDAQELKDLAFYDQLDNLQSLILIEWPEVIQPKLKHYLAININYMGEQGARKYIIKEN